MMWREGANAAAERTLGRSWVRTSALRRLMVPGTGGAAMVPAARTRAAATPTQRAGAQRQVRLRRGIIRLRRDRAQEDYGPYSYRNRDEGGPMADTHPYGC